MVVREEMCKLGTAGGAGLSRPRRFQTEGAASAEALRCEVRQSIWGKLNNLAFLVPGVGVSVSNGEEGAARRERKLAGRQS